MGDKMKSEREYSKEYLLLWNLMMSLESNVVTTEEAEFMYSFDMNRKEDVITLFDLYVKAYFLNLDKGKQNEILQAIDKLSLAEENVLDIFFEYEFGFAPQEPDNRQQFLELVKNILFSYLSISK